MLDLQKIEKEVLEKWEREKIYEKVKKKNSKGKKFYFMDGPPYATGHIHMGTALNKILKDIAMRSRRLQGYDVFDRPGYDTHGVPIELQVEKEIGSRGKQDIEKFGVKKFVERCREYATKHIGVMNSEFANLGVWMDWESPYLTLDDEYIEAIWSAFKKADEKGLLYLGKYSVHVCPRCATAVAYNEIEYAKQTDNSVFVKFPLKEKKNTFLIIWTTTPWTLPANTGIMVHPEVVYQEVETAEGEKWIIAKKLAADLMVKLERSFSVKDEYKGKEMKNWMYENPLSRYMNLKIKNAYKVVLSSRYVTTEEGTGLVHTAPGHGKEDFEVGRENDLDILSPVKINGELTEETGKYAGKKAREVDKEIVDDLRKDGFLAGEKAYNHDYPLCWRDKTPLLMIALPQWFFRISEIQKKILKSNEKIFWVPDYMKLRMKAWLEGIGDWPVSRQRYWGTPLPIWVSESGEKIVVGSVKELQKMSGKKKIGLHKPEIDEIVIKKNGKEFRRVPEVLDVWFDSGVSSWAALNYPSKKQEFEKYWPADLNIEGKDQFRGWWNSQLILSEITFGKKPFESILVHGMILDLGKKKMSKSFGNSVSPQDLISRWGRDYLRYYFAKISRGEDFSFDEKELREIQKVFMILFNVKNFISQLDGEKGRMKVEDKWILSRFNNLADNVVKRYNEYKFSEVVSMLEKFVVNDLSRSYIQLIRERADEVKGILEEVYSGVLRLFAPICPLLAEHLWDGKESIHLSSVPKAEGKKINKKLEKDFEIVFDVVEKGLALRDKEGIGLRWPLSKAEVNCPENLGKDLQKIIARQLNVKEVVLKKSDEISISLNLKMTPELEAEGFARELARAIQAERKKAGLKKGEEIELKIFLEKEMIEKLSRHSKFLQERTNSKKIDFIVGKDPSERVVFTIKEKRFGVKFS